MIHEACDIVADAGGWTCRTCHAHWRTSFPPENCADTSTRDVATADTAVFVVLAILVIGAAICLAVGLAGGLAP